jgi:hypothetical protein
MHRLLKGSSLVVEQGGGNHGITLSGNACLDKHLATYLTNGKVPHGNGVADAVCKKNPDPKPQPATQQAPSALQPALAAAGDSLRGMAGFGR